MSQDWYNIPYELRSLPQWMVASADSKAPISAKTGHAASKTDPRNWVSFEDAVLFASQRGMRIGFCPHEANDLVVVDFDYKQNPKVKYDPELVEMKKGFYRSIMHGYIERSKSGTGYHAVVRGQFPRGINIQKAGLEIYGHGGFVVMTGWMENEEEPREIIDASDAIAWFDEAYPKGGMADVVDGLEFFRELSPEEESENQAFLDKVSTWRNADKIEHYFEGRDTGDDGQGGSTGDLALMQMLWKYTEDEQRTVDMFMRTPRARKLGRKPDPAQYVKRTLATAKAMIAKDAEAARIATPEGMAEAINKMYQQQIAAKQAKQPDSAPTPGDIRKVGNMVQKLASGGKPSLPTALQSPFHIKTAEELCSAPPLTWIVKKILPAQGLAAIYGASGTGKSFLALDLAAAVAEGEKWFHHRVSQVPVVYLALEGGAGMRVRVQAWVKAKTRNMSDELGFIYDAQFNLRSEDGNDIIKLGAAIKAAGMDGGLLIVDTLNQASAGADENSSKDMGEMVSALKGLQLALGGLILIVHHSGKDKDRGMRGHSSLHAALDAIIEVEPDYESGQGLFKWRLAKAKDSAAIDDQSFSLDSVMLGFDTDNDVVDSLVVRPIRNALPTCIGEKMADGGEDEGYGYEGSGGGGGGRPRVMFNRPVAKNGRGASGGAGTGKGPGRPSGGGRSQQAVVGALTKLLTDNGDWANGGDGLSGRCVEFHKLLSEASKDVAGPTEGERFKAIRKVIAKLDESGLIKVSTNMQYVNFGNASVSG